VKKVVAKQEFWPKSTKIEGQDTNWRKCALNKYAAEESKLYICTPERSFWGFWSFWTIKLHKTQKLENFFCFSVFCDYICIEEIWK
jgi:hypothetical protein